MARNLFVRSNRLVLQSDLKFASGARASQQADKSSRAARPALGRRRVGRSILVSPLTSRYCDYIRVCANVIYIDGLVSACQAFNPFTRARYTYGRVWRTTRPRPYTVCARRARVQALTYAMHADFPMCRLREGRHERDGRL